MSFWKKEISILPENRIYRFFVIALILLGIADGFIFLTDQCFAQAKELAVLVCGVALFPVFIILLILAIYGLFIVVMKLQAGKIGGEQVFYQVSFYPVIIFISLIVIVVLIGIFLLPSNYLMPSPGLKSTLERDHIY